MKRGLTLAVVTVGTLGLAVCGSDDSSHDGHATQSSVAGYSQSASTPSSAPSRGGDSSSAQSTSGSSTSSASSAATQPGTAAGGASYQGSGWSMFSSPSGKNLCSFQENFVACRLSPQARQSVGGKSTVTLGPGGVAYLEGDPPIALSLGEGGAWATNGSGPVPPARDNTYVLPYGSSLSENGITCASSSNGFTCSNSAGRFTVNSQGVTTG